jgi:hypothetical protein
MSRFPCSVCKGRVLGKMAVAYWAWFKADGERTAWKVRYCAECAAKHFSQLFQTLRSNSTATDLFICTLCGGRNETDSDPVWLTLYVPGQQVRELEVNLDGACAAKLRGPLVSFGEQLENRELGSRRPSTVTSAWDALGAELPE